MGKKLAVLVGCNYPKTKFKLHGCINDVLEMENVLKDKFSFQPEDITVLTDALDTLSDKLPTGANITSALMDMVATAKEGDVLFFQFSGHGTTVPTLDPGRSFEDGEAIVPCDMNLITDMDLRRIIGALPANTSFTTLSDSCHSGGLIDKDKEQIGPHSTLRKLPTPRVYYKKRSIPIETVRDCLLSVSSKGIFSSLLIGLVTNLPTIVEAVSPYLQSVFQKNVGSVLHDAFHKDQVLSSLLHDTQKDIGTLLLGHFNEDASIKFLPPDHPKRHLDLQKSLTEDEGILLSACQANETAADVAGYEKIFGEKAHGAFTNAVLEILKDKDVGSINNKDLVMEARKRLASQGFHQHPCLYCSNGNANAIFLGDPPLTNSAEGAASPNSAEQAAPPNSAEQAASPNSAEQAASPRRGENDTVHNKHCCHRRISTTVHCKLNNEVGETLTHFESKSLNGKEIQAPKSITTTAEFEHEADSTGLSEGGVVYSLGKKKWVVAWNNKCKEVFTNIIDDGQIDWGVINYSSACAIGQSSMYFSEAKISEDAMPTVTATLSNLF